MIKIDNRVKNKILGGNMKKAYKVFEPDWVCRDYDYKRNGKVIGEIYEMDGEIEICERGFHYCPKLVNCFNYYGFNSNNKVAEIEILGDIKNDDDVKEVTNKFKIIRELSWHEVLELANVGSGNTGNRNSGDWNSGNRNSGNRNSGNRNSGDWNSGDWNLGYLNTITPDSILVFNKECSRETWDKAIKPDFMYSNVLNKFIYICDMTDEEKENNPDYETLGGYLRKMTYKEAWKHSWDNANKENRKLVLKLPNFDNEIFKEITGIDVCKELEIDK